jgi:NADH:ubiquinone oxidoreductase subunit 3 (subunit A)
MIKTIQYVSLSILLTIFLEGLLTMGWAFDFNKYGVFAWLVQAIILTTVVTTALRIRQEQGD